MTWSRQARDGHCSRTQLTWPACRRRRVSDLLSRPRPHTSPFCHLLPIPDSDTSHSCLWAPQSPPHPGALGLERSSLWATGFLGPGLCPVVLSHLRPGRKGGGGAGKGIGGWCAGKAAHCGTRGRSRVLERGGDREPEDMASFGSAWNRPGGETTLPLPDSCVRTPSNQATHCPETPEPAGPKPPPLAQET